jgi:hypothetical protein
MDRIPEPMEAAVTAAVGNASRPRRRWSDGPSYPWSGAAHEEWSVTAQWPALVALLCEHITRSTNAIQQELDRLHADGRIARSDSGAIQGSAQTLRAAGMAAQQIVRLGAGFVQPAGERLDLTALARQAVQERQPELLRIGAEVRFDIRPAEVLLDGPVAVELMNALLDWALSFSSRVRLKIDADGASKLIRLIATGSLPFEASQPGASPRRRDRRMSDNLHWFLLRQLAACCNLRISRSSTAATESAVIEFPKSFVCADGVASVELLPGAKAQSCLRDLVLVIVRDRSVRETVLKLILRNGLEPSVAENCEQARELCASKRPKVLVSCHESIGVAQLRAELMLDGLSCAHIQIVRATPSFHAHGFCGHELVKVGRNDLARELVPALLFELAQQT